MAEMTYTFSGNMKGMLEEEGVNESISLYACNGCGAQILDEDKTTHDKFHTALAELYESWVR